MSEEGIQGRNFFTHSRGGSIIKEEADLNTRHFTYNSKNQQVKVTCEDGQTQVNRYDPEGLRYEMKENEKLFRFLYHRGELLYEEGKEEQSRAAITLVVEQKPFAGIRKFTTIIRMNS